MSGLAGEGRPRRVEGWSGVPLSSRLPSIGLVVLVGIAAVVRPTAPVVFIGILFGYLVLRRFGRPTIAFAAVLPVAAILVWRSIPQPAADPLGADCTNLLAPPAVWRFLEGIIGIVAIVALLVERRARAGELGLRRGSRTVVTLSIVGLLVVTPIAIYAGTLVGDARFGGGFFGTYRLDLSQPMALLPALVFAASNSVAEELAYRGAMRTWLAPSLGVMGANLAQAAAFGLAHTGEDFVGVEAVVPTMAAMIVVGFVGGVIARRTGSLTLPIAIHLAADIPIYLYWACRVG